MLKKIILLFIATIASLFLIEILFHVLNYQIKLDDIHSCSNLFEEEESNEIKFIKDFYIEIYDDFFVEKDGYYIKQRTSLIDVGEQKFKKNKDNDVKRIFIVGESVAAYYDTEIFKKNLEEYIPKQKFEIINVGMGAYDSYRIERILKEIVNYKPDCIIMMIGNNDGFLFNTITINYLPYKYKAFRNSYVLNAISNLIMPRYKYDMQNVFPFFKQNIKKMIKDVNSICPMIFVTLPQNMEYDTNEFKERRDFFRFLPDKYKFVYVADFDKTLKSFIKEPRYDVFFDNCHYHNVFYDFISKLIIKTIDSNIKIDVNKEYILNLLEKDIDVFFQSIQVDNIKLDKFIEYVKSVYMNIDDFTDKYRMDLLKTFIYIYGLYVKPETLYSEEKLKEIICVLEEMIKKYPDKESTYIFKALFDFKIGNKESFEENINIALKINPDIVKKIK